MTLSYGVVVLYFRAGPRVYETLARLLKQSIAPEFIVVVDNASNDGVVRNVEELDPRIRLVTLPRNLGYSGGMNVGFAMTPSSVDYVLFVTHETAVEPGAAEQLLLAADRLGAAAAGPLLRRTRDNSVWSAGGFISKTGRAMHSTSPSDSVHSYPVTWLDGAALLIRASAFVKISGFDTRYFLYWEDVDVSLRLAKEGVVICVPSAIASQDTNSMPPYYGSRNRLLLWRSHGRPLLVFTSTLSETRRTFRNLRYREGRNALARIHGLLEGLSARI